ncbi:hypothetical protein SK128_017472, partial [Halocaridina rubra]
MCQGANNYTTEGHLDPTTIPGGHLEANNIGRALGAHNNTWRALGEQQHSESTWRTTLEGTSRTTTL